MTGYSPGSKEYRRVVVALFLAGLASFAMIHTTQPILPELADAFNLSPAAATLSLSATTLSLGVALLFVGPLSDAIGRVRIIHASLFSAAILTLLIPLVNSWPLLVGLRALVGIVVAGLPAVAVPYLREEIDRRATARVTGLYIGGSGIGGMTGRLVAGFAADLWGWQGGIAAVGVLSLISAILVFLLLPASQGFSPVDLRARELLTSGLRALRNRGLFALNCVGFLTMGALGATFNALGFRLSHEPYNLSPGLIGLIFVVYAFGSVASARAGRTADRIGPRPVAIVALLLAVIGEIVTLFAPLWLVILGTTLMTIGFFACHGVVSAWVGARAQQAGVGAGQASALYLFLYYVGSALAGTMAGACWSHGGWIAVVAMTGTMFFIAFLLTLTVPQPHIKMRNTSPSL